VNKTVTNAPAIAPETLFRPVSREIADDRWLSLMQDRVNSDEPSDLSDRLDAILGELAGGMGREPVSGTETVLDLADAIGEWLVAWAMAGGVSPTEAGQHVTFTAARWPTAEEGAA
jgi:hypothetical protein